VGRQLRARSVKAAWYGVRYRWQDLWSLPYLLERSRWRARPFRALLRAFGESWLTQMSGPETVPLTILAVPVSGLFVFSSHEVWRTLQEAAMVCYPAGPAFRIQMDE
jgi:hypothetical protein